MKLGVSTDLKRDFCNTERSLCDVIHLVRVNSALALYGRADF